MNASSRSEPTPSCPPSREDIELHTADGLTLVGELALPAGPRPVATLICLHPLPTHGGMMDSHVLPQGRLAAAGAGRHRGAALQHPGNRQRAGHQRGRVRPAAVDERFDVAAAIEYAEFPDLPNIWLVGWSFGTDLALHARARPGGRGRDPALPAAALLPRPTHLAAWAESGKPVTALVPEFDDYLRPAEARAVRRDPAGRGGRRGRCQAPVGRRRREGAGRDRPPGRARVAVPLPSDWDGPMETGDASAYADRTVAAFADAPPPD